MHPNKFESAEAARKAIFAGDAIITLVSLVTGTRYTYRITYTTQEEGPYAGRETGFVKMLTGPENSSDYTYMGMMSHMHDAVKITKASKYKADSPPVRAINYALGNLLHRNRIAPNLEIWHEGRCCRCGRTLTVPSSIAAGIGPDCAEKMAQ